MTPSRDRHTPWLVRGWGSWASRSFLGGLWGGHLYFCQCGLGEYFEHPPDGARIRARLQRLSHDRSVPFKRVDGCLVFRRPDTGRWEHHFLHDDWYALIASFGRRGHILIEVQPRRGARYWAPTR